MKIITTLFSLFLSLHIQVAVAGPGEEAAPYCHFGDSLNILSDPLMKPFQDIQYNFSLLVCDEDVLYGDPLSMIPKVDHDRTRCESIALCNEGLSDTATTKDAQKIVEENLPKAALLGVFAKEIADHRDYNIQLKKYEDANHEKLCPVEAGNFGCDLDVRKAFMSVANSFSDLPELDKAPISTDNLGQFIDGKFFKDPNPKSAAKSKEELLKGCADKFSLNKICKLRDDRVSEIKTCEKSVMSKGCLDNEQKALASLLSDYKKNKTMFLALERELCLPTRITKNSATQTTLYTNLSGMPSSPYGSGNLLRVNYAQFITRPDLQLHLPSRSPASSSQDDKTADDKSSPNASGVKKIEDFKIDPIKQQAVARDEVKEARDATTLSETFANTMRDAVSTETKVISNTPASNTTAWSSDFSNRFNSITEEQRKKNEEEKNKEGDKSGNDSVSSAQDKKKKEEMDALLAKISGLKSKLEEMNQKVDDLKNKKVSDGDEKAAVDKEALEKEKSILDLKKKLADLEADKIKREAESVKKQEAENVKVKSQAENTRVSNNSNTNFQNRNDGDQQADTVKREREKSANNFQAATGSFSEGRAPASVGAGFSGPQGSSSAIVLKVAGAQATPDSTVVYMTANELQKYPFHLADNASSIEIEKMLENNNGSSIIIGDSEQIIPIVINGAVALDENGKVKFKRVKISLVKNERERKQNIAREISSVADLKRIEQKNRDLIRYQEMKNSLKLDK